jgi:hypothetical protein
MLSSAPQINRAVSLEEAMRARAARVNDPFSDTLAVKVCNLFQKLVVLKDRWPTVSDGAVILVIIE